MAVYFASDFHLGLDSRIPSKKREEIIISWLEEIKYDVSELYLIGDTFDFWFEYAQVAPKGHIRLLGKLAEVSDAGVPIFMFTGNHDMWMFGYLEKEIGVTVIKKPLIKNIQGLKFYIAHGDGLGPGDKAYKFIKLLFSNSINQWLFSRIHPNLGILLMKFFSKKSRDSEQEIVAFKGPDNERLIQYSEELLEKQYFDFFIFGHRHLPIDHILSNNQSRYVNTGDWIHHFSYAKLENNELKLLNYEYKI